MAMNPIVEVQFTDENGQIFTEHNVANPEGSVAIASTKTSLHLKDNIPESIEASVSHPYGVMLHPDSTTSPARFRQVLEDLSDQANRIEYDRSSTFSSMGLTDVMEEVSVSAFSNPSNTTATTVASPQCADAGASLVFFQKKIDINAAAVPASMPTNGDSPPHSAVLTRLVAETNRFPPAKYDDHVQQLNISNHLRQIHDDVIQSREMSLFYISRLEVELGRMRRELSTVMKTLQDENLSLRHELERATYFY